MAQRIKRNEIDDVFGPNQNQPLNEVEITDDLRHSVPVFNEPSLGTGGTKIPPLPHGGEEKRPGRFSRIKSAINDVGNVLAEPSVGMAVGRFAEAFGQGDERSAATILGKGAQELSSEKAQGEIARRLLSGEDISDIPAEMLATAGPEARQQIIQVAEQRADREQRTEDMEMRKGLQERALTLQSRGLDLRAFGVMIEHDDHMARLDANEIERRLNVAESANEINQQLANSLGRLRDAQIQALLAEQEGTTVNPENIMRETRELLDNLRRSMQVSQEQIEILRADMQQERGAGDPESTRSGTLAYMLEETVAGRQVDQDEIRDMRAPTNTNEYYELEGRLKVAEESLARDRELYDQLARQQAERIGGATGGQRQQTREATATGQFDGREPLPTQEEMQQRGAPEITDLSEANQYEDNDILLYEGQLYRKEGDKLIIHHGTE